MLRPEVYPPVLVGNLELDTEHVTRKHFGTEHAFTIVSRWQRSSTMPLESRSVVVGEVMRGGKWRVVAMPLQLMQLRSAQEPEQGENYDDDRSQREEKSS